jgi:diguanylate cyclase (GGDEF)-like protein
MESLGMFLRTPRRILSLLVCGVPAFGKAGLAQSFPRLSLAELPLSKLAAAAPRFDLDTITWTLLLTAAVAIGAAFWATVLRFQVQAKTSDLRHSLEAQKKAHEFDAARNDLLENIAQNSPLPQNMEKLALAIERQIPDSACAIVMPADGKSFTNGRPCPVLIAPSLPAELHPEIVHAIGPMFNLGDISDSEIGIDNKSPVTTLLGILWACGLSFCTAHTTIAFSGSGEAAGLVIVFLRRSSDIDPTENSILQSASRLVSLAGDHCRMHERLLHEAHHDSLTGLPNRMVAEDRLEQALARADRARKQFAVFCIDLDGFKGINDELGHDAGDEILRSVALRLQNNLRHSDTLARVGGDEFVVLIEDCSGGAAAQAVAQSLITSLQQPFLLSERQLRVSASIGVAMYPADASKATQLRRNADLAMYRAKSLGGRQVALWSGELASTAKALQKSSSV